MNEGFPELTDAFLSGQDIFYTQFNEIEFYVEDTDQENFYFNILKNLFSDLKFEKIFPLNGKMNVKDSARLNLGNRKKVFIVDLDFDGILGTVEVAENLFYLKKYSIENYLISKESLYEVIRIKNPTLKNRDIDSLYDYNSVLNNTSKYLSELACSFITIQKYNLGIDYYGINTNRDFVFTHPHSIYRLSFIPDYFRNVENELKKKDRRYSLTAHVKKLKTNFNTTNKALSNIPGKHILTFIKERLKALNLIHQMTVDSFAYVLCKEIDSNELNFLKTAIERYIS
jgi:hypothetical protein